MCNLLLLRVVGWQRATNRKTSFVSINKMHLKVTSISAKSSFVPVATSNILKHNSAHAKEASQGGFELSGPSMI